MMRKAVTVILSAFFTEDPPSPI